MASVLETAMDRFLRLHLGGERIDDLLLDPRQRAGRKADYFVDDRRVVVEIKLLVDERTSAVQRVLDEFRRLPDWASLQRELASDDGAHAHPRVAEYRRRMFVAVTKSVERCAENANQQIAETAQNFGLEAPRGVLVFLNERVDVLEPGVVATAASNALGARRENGVRELEHLHGIVVVTRSRAPHGAADAARTPVLRVAADELTADERTRAFETRIVDEWSAFLELRL